VSFNTWWKLFSLYEERESFVVIMFINSCPYYLLNQLTDSQEIWFECNSTRSHHSSRSYFTTNLAIWIWEMGLTVLMRFCIVISCIYLLCFLIYVLYTRMRTYCDTLKSQSRDIDEFTRFQFLRMQENVVFGMSSIYIYIYIYSRTCL
jgi:hypothetical protein